MPQRPPSLSVAEHVADAVDAGRPLEAAQIASATAAKIARDSERLRIQRIVTELEAQQRFFEAGPYKTQLARLASAPFFTNEAQLARVNRMGELRTQIGALEAAGDYGDAAPLKTTLARLASGLDA